MFKTPDQGQVHEMYALGMERLAYRQGTTIGLRVPVVWLEKVNGQHGALVERITDGRDIEMASSCVMLMTPPMATWIRPVARFARRSPSISQRPPAAGQQRPAH